MAVPGLLSSCPIDLLAITYCSTINMSLDCSWRWLCFFVLSPLLGWAAPGHHDPWTPCRRALALGVTSLLPVGAQKLGADWLSFNFWVWSYLCGLAAGDYKVLYGIGTEKKHTDCLLSGHLCLFIPGTFSTYSVSHLSHMQYGTDSGYHYIYVLPRSHLLLFTTSAKPPPWPHTFHLLTSGMPGTACYQQ